MCWSLLELLLRCNFLCVLFTIIINLVNDSINKLFQLLAYNFYTPSLCLTFASLTQKWTPPLSRNIIFNTLFLATTTDALPGYLLPFADVSVLVLLWSLFFFIFYRQFIIIIILRTCPCHFISCFFKLIPPCSFEGCY